MNFGRVFVQLNDCNSVVFSIICRLICYFSVINEVKVLSVNDDFLYLSEVMRSVQIPVLIGSGVTHENVDDYLQADALIVGSHFKNGGRWENSVDPVRVTRFMEKIHKLRN